MSPRHISDPMDALRAADPLRAGDVPEDTAGSHARALFQEVIEMDTQQRGDTKSPSARRPLAWVAAAVAASAALVAGFLFLGRGEELVVGGQPVGSAASCVETYDLVTLANREVAFDGTAASIDGDQVTFTVNRWFTGGTGDDVTLTAMGLTGVTSAGGPVLELGTRYLVSGSGGFVWACGFTMTYDSAIADEWAQIFGG